MILIIWGSGSRVPDCNLIFKAVRDVIPGIPVGKILIQRDETSKEKLPILFYEKYPPNIHEKEILLCDPMLATGGSAIMGKIIIPLT